MATLSIGLPVRNGSRYLAEALACVRAQEVEDFELLIADNASDDETEEICRAAAAADPRIRYVRHPENIGVSGNFNHVFHHTGGEFFAWLACDDRFDPRFYRRCLDLLTQRPDTVGAFSAVELIGTAGERLRPEPEPIRADHPDVAVRFADLASYRHYCQMSFAVVRRSVAASTRLLQPFWGSDRLYLTELGLRGPLVRDPEALFLIRQHTERETVRVARREHTVVHSGGAGSRAITYHYARQLYRAIERAGLDPAEQRRVRRAMVGWAAENWLRLGRSAGRRLTERVGAALPSRAIG